MPRTADCRSCHCRPARAADDFCSDVCARDYSYRCDRADPRETTAGEMTRDLWDSCHRRANLQNSA